MTTATPTSLYESYDTRLYILETKYALARFIVDKLQLKATDYITIERNIQCEFTVTMQKLLSNYRFEKQLYNNLTRQEIRRSFRYTATDNSWMGVTRTLQLESTPDMQRIEVFNMSPLTLGHWVSIHARYEMEKIGYALPLYTAHGLDALHEAVINYAAKFELNHDYDDTPLPVATTINTTPISYHIVSVQNIPFYRIFTKEQSFIVWLDSPNFSENWSVIDNKGFDLIDRVYIMVKDTNFEDPLLKNFLDSLFRDPMLVFSSNMPYDLKPFEVLQLREDPPQSVTVNGGDIWANIQSIPGGRRYLIAQQTPRTYEGDLFMPPSKLYYWLNKNRLPSNMLVRLATDVTKAPMESDRDSFKFVYIPPPSRRSILHVYDMVTLNGKLPRLPNLGPLMPPIIMGKDTFAETMAVNMLMQNVYWVGGMHTLIITTAALRPMSRPWLQKFKLETMRTITIEQMNQLMANYFQQCPAEDHRTLTHVTNTFFMEFKYADVMCYAFMSSAAGKIAIIHIYKTIFRLLMERADAIMENKNLCITLSHFLDYLTSSTTEANL